MITKETTMKCDGEGCQTSLRTFTKELPTVELKQVGRANGWKIKGQKHLCPNCRTKPVYNIKTQEA